MRSSYWATIYLLVWAAAASLAATSRGDALQALVGELAEQNEQIGGELNKLRAYRDTVKRQQSKLVANFTRQRLRDTLWQRNTAATIATGSAAAAAAVGRPERRGLAAPSHTCTPHAFAVQVEGICTCTGGMTAHGMNITQVIDGLFANQARPSANSTNMTTSNTTVTVEPIDWAELQNMETDSATGSLIPTYTGATWKLAMAYATQTLTTAGDFIEFKIASYGEFMVGFVCAPDEDNPNAIYETDSMFFRLYKHLYSGSYIKAGSESTVSLGHLDYSLPFKIVIKDDLTVEFSLNGTVLVTSDADVPLPGRIRADSANGGKVFFASFGHV